MIAANTPSYSPGLEGVIAGESAICQVDPDAGLLYRGYDLHELAAQASFEEVAWLLLNGELPEPSQLWAFREQLDGQRALPEAVLAMLQLSPRDAHPMDLLRSGISMLGEYDPDLNDHSHEANLRKSVRLLARTSTLVASAWRISQGLKPVVPSGGVGHAQTFLSMLWGAPPQPWQVHIIDVLFTAYAEHEFNASTFAARVTASTLADIYAAVTSAIGTLKGPLHGGANEQAMAMLREIARPEHAAAWLEPRLMRREKIMGFGHRVYKKGDSRVPVLRQLAQQLGHKTGQPQWVEICQELERLMELEKGLYANADLYAAPLFYMMGIPSSLNTPIFACSRVCGWCAHVIEQHDHNRLIRPRSLYTGPSLRPMPPRRPIQPAWPESAIQPGEKQRPALEPGIPPLAAIDPQSGPISSDFDAARDVPGL